MRNYQNESAGIKRLPFSRMLKSEVADFADMTMNIVQSHDVESVIINPVFDRLMAKKPDIQLLRISYGIDTERLRVSKLKGEMMLVISAFKLEVRMLKRSNLELDLHVIENAIDTYLRRLNKSKNDKSLNQKIVGFTELVETDARLSADLRKYSLMEAVENIELAHANFRSAFEKRVVLLSQRPKIATSVIIKGVLEAIGNLFSGIALAQLIGADTDAESGEVVDYTPLINELGQLTELYNRSIIIRDANNKRKANAQSMPDVGDLDANGDTTAPETAPTSNTMLCATCAKPFGEGSPIEPTDAPATNPAEGDDEATSSKLDDDSIEDADVPDE